MIITVNNGATETVVQVFASSPAGIGSITGLTAALAAKAAKNATVLTGIPTSDPAIEGAVWSNGGVLMISEG